MGKASKRKRKSGNFKFGGTGYIDACLEHASPEYRRFLQTFHPHRNTMGVRHRGAADVDLGLHHPQEWREICASVGNAAPAQFCPDEGALVVSVETQVTKGVSHGLFPPDGSWDAHPALSLLFALNIYANRARVFAQNTFSPDLQAPMEQMQRHTASALATNADVAGLTAYWQRQVPRLFARIDEQAKFMRVLNIEHLPYPLQKSPYGGSEPTQPQGSWGNYAVRRDDGSEAVVGVFLSPLDAAPDFAVNMLNRLLSLHMMGESDAAAGNVNLIELRSAETAAKKVETVLHLPGTFTAIMCRNQAALDAARNELKRRAA